MEYFAQRRNLLCHIIQMNKDRRAIREKAERDTRRLWDFLIRKLERALITKYNGNESRACQDFGFSPGDITRHIRKERGYERPFLGKTFQIIHGLDIPFAEILNEIAPNSYVAYYKLSLSMRNELYNISELSQSELEKMRNLIQIGLSLVKLQDDKFQQILTMLSAISPNNKQKNREK